MIPSEASVLDEHLRDEFQLKDAEAKMRTRAPEPYLTHAPTLTGGTGYQEVGRFCEHHFIPGWPTDVEVTGRWVELLRAVVVGLEDGKVAYEHVYWDQGSACSRRYYR
jgi:hypothetical protein